LGEIKKEKGLRKEKNKTAIPVCRMDESGGILTKLGTISRGEPQRLSTGIVSSSSFTLTRRGNAE